MSRRRSYAPTLNPYIALADMLLNLVLILLLLLPLIMLLGSRGWDDIRYKTYQAQMATAIRTAMPAAERPVRQNRHDAPGEQRWMFRHVMFEDTTPPTLSPQGMDSLRRFAAVLNAHKALWWRIRVESHVPENGITDEASLHLTADRAITVSTYLFKKCGIPPWKLTTSGRGFQDLLHTRDKTSRENERIDLLLIPPPQEAQHKPPVAH